LSKRHHRFRKKIHLFKEGKIDEERFRSLRLARGVYGQRQEGVQMIRIVAFGKVTGSNCGVYPKFLTNIRQDVCITTRQDIQFTM
jgi:sulfite reductase (ferredoxin)